MCPLKQFHFYEFILKYVCIVHKDKLARIFIANLSTVQKDWKQSLCSLIHDGLHKLWYNHKTK